MGNGARGQHLKSWKEIAAFFGADERTVRRWEQRGLPVHRVPGGARPTIYANVGELEEWLSGRAGREVQPPIAPILPQARNTRWLAGTFAALVVLAAVAFVLTQTHAPGVTRARHQVPQRVIDLYLAGTYDRERRTPASLQRAVDEFGRAIGEDPAYADAYAGLADTYLMLREYSGMPDAQAYPRAREAAQRALALDRNSDEAHATLAFVTFFWIRDWPRGLREFQHAVELNPRSAEAWHWYGTALYHSGRLKEALRAISEAQRVDPTSRSIIADRALIAYHAGQKTQAIATLRELETSDPEYYSSHAYLAAIYGTEHDLSASVREAQAAARLRGDPDQSAVADAAAAGLQSGGQRGMLRAMLAQQESIRRQGRGSDYELAAMQAQIGERDAALRSLATSNDEGEAAFVSIRMDLRFGSLQGDPRFKQLLAAAERPAPRKV